MTQVRIDESNNSYSETLLGVVTNSPDTFTLPEHFLSPMPDVLCVASYIGFIFGEQVRVWCLAW